jgi:opacity protein-like surface antigen
MKPTTTTLLAASALLLAALPAAAQPYGPPETSFEITPFGAYRFGGEFDSVDFDDDFFDLIDVEVDDGAAFGVAFDARLGGGLFLELWASRQETELTENAGIFLPTEALFDLEVDYYHAGILYEWRPGQAHPFFAASVGATRFSPDAPGLDDLVRPSFSLGGGVKLMFSDNVGLRLEGRLVTTLVEEDDEEFCSRRVCYDFDEDIYFYQGEARAGLVVAF